MAFIEKCERYRVVLWLLRMVDKPAGSLAQAAHKKTFVGGARPTERRRAPAAYGAQRLAPGLRGEGAGALARVRVGRRVAGRRVNLAGGLARLREERISDVPLAPPIFFVELVTLVDVPVLVATVLNNPGSAPASDLESCSASDCRRKRWESARASDWAPAQS